MIHFRTVRGRLLAAFAVVLVLIGISAALSVSPLGPLHTAQINVTDRAQPFLGHLTDAAVAAKAAANDERGYLLTGDPQFTQEIATLRDPIVYKALDADRNIYGAQSTETAAIDKIVAGYQRWVNARDAELRLYRTDKTQAVFLALNTNRDLRKSYEDSIAKATDLAKRDVTHSNAVFQSDENNARNISIGFAIAALLAAVVLAWWISRSVAGRVAVLTAAADRITAGDVTDLKISVPGHDEIASLGRSMQGVAAAFEELYAALAGSESTQEVA